MKRLIPILLLLVSGVAYGGVGDKYMCDVVQRPWIEFDPRLDNNKINNKPVSEWIYQVKFSIDWISNEKVFIQKYEIWELESKKTYGWEVDLVVLDDDWGLEGFAGTITNLVVGSLYVSFSEPSGRLLIVDSWGYPHGSGMGGYDVYVWHSMCTEL